MKFKSWENFIWFLDNYSNFNCLNCVYGGYQGNSSQILFCTYNLTIIDFNFMNLCVEWKSKNGKILKDYEDCPMYSLDDEVLYKLFNDEISIEDLKGEL